MTLRGGEFAGLLTEFANQLEDEFGDLATVRRTTVRDLSIDLVEVVPSNPRSLAVSWSTRGHFLQAGHSGGIWELASSRDDAEFVMDITRSVMAGRVVETFAPGRSTAVVTLSDGTEEHETGHVALVGLLPMPRWKSWGRTVRYAPYT